MTQKDQSTIKKALPLIITIVMVAVAAFGIVAVVKNNSNEENKKEQKETNKKDEEQEQRIIDVNIKKLSSYSYAEVAADMLERVIKGEEVSKHLSLLESINPDDLEQQLSNDELRLCFWINAYNAHAQYFLKKDPTLYKEDRNEFFKKEQINIAGFNVSMNDIEHGVLRRGATIWSKGHVRIPFRNEFVNKYKVSEVDYRIHFALNCGAKSCPPICVYLPNNTNNQLTKATDYYLNKECEYDESKATVKVPALMTWFADDFGTKEDKRDILRKHKVIPDQADPTIEYKDYDWTMKVDNYKQF